MHARALFLSISLAALPLTAAAQWASEDLSSDGVEVFCLASGDVDGDLLQDLVAGTQDSTILVYRHGEDGLAVAQGIQLADDPMALDVADLDGDGDLDIIYGTRGTVSAGWIPNQGDGTFGTPIGILSPLDQPRRVAGIDADGDGDRDFLYLEHGGNRSLMVVLNDGGAAFSTFEVVSEGVTSFTFQGLSQNPPVPLFSYATTTGEARVAEWDGAGFSDLSTYASYAAIAWAGVANNDVSFDVVVWSTLSSPTPAPTLLQDTGGGFPQVPSVVQGNVLLEQSYSDFNNAQFVEVDTAEGVIRGWTLSGNQYVSEVLASGTSQSNGWAAAHLVDLDGDCDADLVRDDFAPNERLVIGWNPLAQDFGLGDVDEDGVGACGGDCDDNDPTVGSIQNDADCDGAVTAEDCDDNDPDSETLATDADCDAIPTEQDCDDNDPTSNAIIDDRDCDGALSVDDCDDLDPTSFPGGTEVCDGVDNDCDGAPDQGLDCGDDDDSGDDDDAPPTTCGCLARGSDSAWLGVFGLGFLGLRRRARGVEVTPPG